MPAPDVAWTFLTNHAHVLLCLAREPGARMRDVADLVGITERAVQRIIADLEAASYIERTRDGRRNRYSVQVDLPLRHPIEKHRPVSALIALVRGRNPFVDARLTSGDSSVVGARGTSRIGGAEPTADHDPTPRPKKR